MKISIDQLSEPALIVRPINQFEQMLMEESMKEHGLLTPLVVADDVIVDGWRRWLVARGMGWTEIEIHKVDGDPSHLRAICQTNGSDFGSTEKKILVRQHMERNRGVSAAEIAQHFKWSPIEVEQLCCIGYVIPEAKALYDEQKIDLETAWLLGRILNEAQIQLLDSGDLASLRERAEDQLREIKHSRRRAMTTRPRVRSYNKIEKEIERPVYAGPELIAGNAVTPMDGWIAALKWVIEGK